jgi:hypothetical protein
MITISSLITIVGLIAIGPASATGPILDPCTLLTMADVQQAFPGSKAGELDRGQEKLGMLKCIWRTPNGRLFVFTADEITETPRAEAAGTWALTFLDPLRTDAGKHVRYETLIGVGDQAVAVVEREDKAKGFMQAAAILVVRRGKQQVAVLSTDLARLERADALRILGELGKAIAKRVS